MGLVFGARLVFVACLSNVCCLIHECAFFFSLLHITSFSVIWSYRVRVMMEFPLLVGRLRSCILMSVSP
jgi:branched-subunit amino acid permease